MIDTIVKRLSTNYRLLLIAVLLTGIAFDSSLVPFFNETIWLIAYIFVALNFLGYWWFYNHKWLLRASSVLCSIGSVRAMSFAFAGRLNGFCANALIVVLVWIIYGLRAPEFREE